MNFEKLQDIANVIDSLHKTPQYSETGYSMVRCTDVKYGFLNLQGTLKVSKDIFDEFSRRYTPSLNDIVITRVGTYGITALVQDVEFCLGQNTSVIIAKNINPKYLYVVLNSPILKYQIEASVVGSTQKTLSLKAINSLEIPRFSSKVEDRIAKIISELDDKIHLNNQINQTLESIAQAIFKSWFIDFDPVRAKIAAKQEGKDPELAAMCAISGKSEAELEQMAEDDFAELQATAALFPDELVESELGEVPNGWEYKKLKDLCRVINGRAYKNTEFKEEGIPIVRIQNLTGGGKTVFSDLHLPQDKLIEKEDFIYAWSATFGPYIWRGPKSIYHYHIWKMDVDETIISRYFLYLTMFRKTESMKSAGTGSIFTHLTKVIMESQDVLIADKTVNILYKDRVDKIFKLISLKHDEINNLQNLRDTLLPKLLSGELDVSGLQGEGIDG